MAVPIKRVLPPTEEEMGIRPDDPVELKAIIRQHYLTIKYRLPTLRAEMEIQKRNVEMMRQRVSPSMLPLIQNHISTYQACKACELGKDVFHNQHVFFRGFVPASVLFIGEAPTEAEDTIGRPFVGQAGSLLNQIIYDSFCKVFEPVLFDLFYWCVTTVVACKARSNDPNSDSTTRPPTATEARTCSPRLLEFIQLVKPKIIVLMGQAAEKYVPKHISVRRIVNPLAANLAAICHAPASQVSFVSIRDPYYILRQKDQELEIRRAVLLIANAYEKYLTQPMLTIDSMQGTQA